MIMGSYMCKRNRKAKKGSYVKENKPFWLLIQRWLVIIWYDVILEVSKSKVFPEIFIKEAER